MYSEELIDRRLITATRRAAAAPGVVEFVNEKTGQHVFSTVAREAGRNVLQIGTANATLALQAATIFARDVAAIDINMGCPKPFSTHCGMGQGLLSTPELAADIIGTLRRNLPIPVTCKMRVLGSAAESVEFARRMEAAGAVAIGVHARYKHERPNDRAHWVDVRPIVDAVRVPVLVNGDVFVYEDIARARAATGASSVMIARGALRSPAVFRPVDTDALDVCRKYVQHATDVGNYAPNSKFCLMHFLKGRRGTHPGACA